MKRRVNGEAKVTNDESTWNSVELVPDFDKGAFNDYLGELGAQYVNIQTGTIRGGRIYVPGSYSEAWPDGIVRDLDDMIEEVKVGRASDVAQASYYAVAIRRGMGTPGTYYFLESPASGLVGPVPALSRVMRTAGFDSVCFHGPWWEFFQDRGEKATR